MTYCGNNCCEKCSRFSECGGCEKCAGHPFGGSCIVERNRDFSVLKQQLIEEIDALGIDGLIVDALNLLGGESVNPGYPLSNGTTVFSLA